jgi:hypothetical protein
MEPSSIGTYRTTVNGATCHPHTHEPDDVAQVREIEGEREREGAGGLIR